MKMMNTNSITRTRVDAEPMHRWRVSFALIEDFDPSRQWYSVMVWSTTRAGAERTVMSAFPGMIWRMKSTRASGGESIIIRMIDQLKNRCGIGIRKQKRAMRRD